MTATPVLDRAAVLAITRLELLVAAPDVPADAPFHVHLVRDLGVDSVGLVEFVARLEYRYGLSVPDTDWPLLGTLDEVATYIVDRVRQDPR
ncbi:MAG: acyl carrier protein [Nocardioides sp.]